MNHNLSAQLARAAGEHRDRVAVLADGETWTYEQLWTSSMRVAGALRRHGVTRGDRVGWLLPNGFPAAAINFGILAVAGVVVPLSPLLRAREVAQIIADSGARVLLLERSRIAELASAESLEGVDLVAAEDVLSDRDGGWEPIVPVAVSSDDPAYLIYTSGTTGRPKGVILSHANLAQNAQVALDLQDASAEDVVFGGLPLTHIFGQSCVLHAAVRVGAAMTLDARFDAVSAMRRIREDGISVFVGVPTMFVALLAEIEALGAETIRTDMRIVISGGAALPVDVLEGFERSFGAPILESYGLTEGTGYVLSERREHVARDRRSGERVPGSVGVPVRGCEVKLVRDDGESAADGECGEIHVRGGNVTPGYWGDPVATAATIDSEGWLRTGDLARRDSVGRFFIVGRKKELIVRGGHNVHPREVEEVLHSHPQVREAAVLGAPDLVLGEEVIAAVALTSAAGDVQAAADAIRDYARANLAAYKYPRRVKVFDELPKNPNGKVLKQAIEIF